MRKLSIIAAHYRTSIWTAIMVAAFKKYPFSIESELIICDNSPGHPSIKAITETPLGEGVKVIQGNPDFPSHGHGYDLCYEQSGGDWIMCTETDAFPIMHGWGEHWIKASTDFDMIGPLVPQSSGAYIHPAGCMYRRELVERAKQWQEAHKQWVFVPGAGAMLKTHPKACHVVAHQDWLSDQFIPGDMQQQIDLWKLAGPFQEMRSFDEDTFEDYGKRTGIANFEPVSGKMFYNKIGYESGQWLNYYAERHGYRCMRAPNEIIWMHGHEGRQAAESRVFGSFTHVWGGTVTICSGQNMAHDVVQKKHESMMKFFDLMVPDDIKPQILKIQEECQ